MACDVYLILLLHRVVFPSLVGEELRVRFILVGEKPYALLLQGIYRAQKF